MKKILVAIVALSALASCRHLTGSGNIITETRSTGNFTGISAGQGFEVEVKQGPVTELIVESDDNIIRYIETVVEGSTLKIRLKSNHSFNNAHLKVYLTAPSITHISASSDADIVVKDVLQDKKKLAFRASSSGTIIADVDAPEVEVRSSSGARIELSGRTQLYTCDASSGADIRSGNLLSENTTVNTSSGSTAYVHASITLIAKASSGSDITYKGGANVQKTVNSGASIEKKE